MFFLQIHSKRKIFVVVVFAKWSDAINYSKIFHATYKMNVSNSGLDSKLVFYSRLFVQRQQSWFDWMHFSCIWLSSLRLCSIVWNPRAICMHLHTRDLFNSKLCFSRFVRHAKHKNYILLDVIFIVSSFVCLAQMKDVARNCAAPRIAATAAASFFRHFLWTISYVIRCINSDGFYFETREWQRNETKRKESREKLATPWHANPKAISIPCNAIYTIKFQWIQLSHCSWFLHVPTIKQMKNGWVNEWLHCVRSARITFYINAREMWSE